MLPRIIPVVAIIALLLLIAFVETSADRSFAPEAPRGDVFQGDKAEAVKLGKGTKLHVRLSERVSAEEPSGSFHAVLDRDAKSRGQTVFKAGQVFSGKFQLNRSSPKDHKRPSLTLQLTGVRVGKKKVKLDTEPLALSVPIPRDGARLNALDAEKNEAAHPETGFGARYEAGTRLSFTLAAPVEVPFQSR